MRAEQVSLLTQPQAAVVVLVLMAARLLLTSAALVALGLTHILLGLLQPQLEYLDFTLAAAADLGFDGAEAWYDYDMNDRWQPTPLVCEAIAADLSDRGLLMSCGTDTHGLALHGR
jgi:hypothetical protein